MEDGIYLDVAAVDKDLALLRGAEEKWESTRCRSGFGMEDRHLEDKGMGSIE